MNINIRVISNSTLRWSSGGVVLNTVSLKAHHLAIIQNNRKVDDELPHRAGKHLVKTLIKVKVLGRYAELFAGHAEDVVVCTHGYCLALTPDSLSTGG